MSFQVYSDPRMVVANGRGTAIWFDCWLPEILLEINLQSALRLDTLDEFISEGCWN